MHITVDDFEISVDSEEPTLLNIFNTRTQKLFQLTTEEAMTALKLMINYQDELSLLRTGK